MAARFAGRSAADTERGIVDLVRSSDVISRVELAELSGLTEASISRNVKRLLEDGLLVEVGQSDATGGKPRRLLALNTNSRYAVGLTVDEPQLTYVLTNLRGEVVGRLMSEGIGTSSPPLVVRRMAREIRKLLREHKVSERDVLGIGVAIAGRLDLRGGAMRSLRDTSDWEQFALGPALGEALGLPVTLEHDYVCAALGEFWVGRIPASSDFVCLYAAGGFGAAIMLGGKIYRGSSGNAGEVGHMVLEAGGPQCWCGSRGCLEAVAGPATVVRNALATRALSRRLSLTGSADTVRADFALVAQAATAGDSACQSLIEESAAYVAKALLSLTNTLDLDRIVLSGPAFADASEYYLRAARAAVQDLSFMRQVHPVAVEPSTLETRSAAIGAATVALNEGIGSDSPRAPILAP